MTDQDHIPLGWICPRCGKVWAPTVQCCECEPVLAATATPPGWVATTMLDVSGAEVR